MDHERGRAIRPGLDGERARQERGETPAPGDRGNKRGARRDDRQHDAAGHDRADERGIRQSGRAVPRKEARQPLVVARNPVDVQKDPRDEQACEDRQTRDRSEREKNAEDIRPDRVTLTRQAREPPSERAGLSVENGEVEQAARTPSRGAAWMAHPVGDERLDRHDGRTVSLLPRSETRGHRAVSRRSPCRTRSGITRLPGRALVLGLRGCTRSAGAGDRTRGRLGGATATRFAAARRHPS